MEVKNFSEAVYEAVKKIPKGKVMSYGDVAMAAGRPRAARIVGGVLHRNPDQENIPCHRVVFRCGRLSPGYVFGGEGEQRRHLEEEGVVFLPDGNVNMKVCRFIWRGESL